jgi:hypothetical protein
MFCVTIFYKGLEIWNKTPIHIRSSLNYKAILSNLNEHLMLNILIIVYFMFAEDFQ